MPYKFQFSLPPPFLKKYTLQYVTVIQYHFQLYFERKKKSESQKKGSGLPLLFEKRKKRKKKLDLKRRKRVQRGYNLSILFQSPLIIHLVFFTSLYRFLQFD